MHVIVATDGSRQSLAAAKQLKAFADPKKISDITVIAVIRPLAAVAFADEVSSDSPSTAQQELSFRTAAQDAIDTVAKQFDGWGPKINKKIRSGSPAKEIIKAANQLGAGLIVVASGSRGISDTLPLGSTAQRIQYHAPCPVLVVRRTPKAAKKTASRKK